MSNTLGNIKAWVLYAFTLNGQRLCILLSLFAIVSFWSKSGLAYSLTDAEWATLPEYCHHQNNVSENHRKVPSKEWENFLGSDFDHVHHFCIVYVWIGRAYKAGIGSSQGKYLLGMADDDLTYFIDRMRPGSPLAAEAYTKRGEVYLMQKNYRAAELSFMKAREINPERSQPYFFWAHHLFVSGQYKEALVTAEEGLKYAPQSRTLKTLVADINAAKKR